MKPSWRGFALAALLALPLRVGATEEFFDRLSGALSGHSADGALRARVSGLLDLEGYVFAQPAPALIEARGESLFNPRLTAFLDLQWGGMVYGFVQARVDRGFDPAEAPADARLDEYAVRFTPRADGTFNLQAGKFATVVGNWVPRHGSWDNPFVTAPLAYENLTGMWDSGPPASAGTLLSWAHVRPRAVPGEPADDKHLRLPIIWGPAYAHGVAVSGQLGRLTYAVELKNAAVSARPGTWESARFHRGHEAWGGRLGYRPDPRWNFGWSVSRGAYLAPEASAELPAGRTIADHRQIVVAQDVSFAWHHLQVWAEVLVSRFEIPGLGNADTLAWYAETRYKFTPRFSGAVRWNEQIFARFPTGGGAGTRWGDTLRRLDVAPVFRITPQMQWKFQYSAEFHEEGARAFTHWLGAQFTVKF